MTLNQIILETVTETAKAKAAKQAAWVRAIEKAAEQLISNPYISETENGLLILSYSSETYHANGACGCKAYANGKPCWHRAAAKLVKRYREAEAAQAAAPAPKPEQPAPVMVERIHHKDGAVEIIEHGPELLESFTELCERAGAAIESQRALREQWQRPASPPDERTSLIAEIKAGWQRVRPFASYAIALHQHFGVTRLEDVPTDGLRLIHSLLTPPVRRSPAPAAARPIITQRKALDACTKRQRKAGLDGWWVKRPASGLEAWNA